MLFTACGKKAADEDEKVKSTAVAEVTVAKVTRQDVTATVSVSATVAAPPNEDAKIASLTPGRIATVRVAEGDKVIAGEVLATLDEAPLQEQLRQAEGAAAQAKANAENAKLSLDREQGLFEKGISSRKEVEDARTQVAVTEGAQRAAEAALSVSRMQVARGKLTAPFAGTVVKRYVSAGEQVDGTAANPVVEVANLSHVELQANVPATDLARIRTAQKVDFDSAGKKLQGTVIATSPAVDPTSGLGLVRISVANPDGALRLGQLLNVGVPVSVSKRALTVPAAAVYRNEENQPIIYRVNGDAAEVVQVKLGLQTKDSVEVLDGLKEGDIVIVNGGYGLEDKAKVKIKP